METGSGKIFNEKILERKLNQIKERLKEKTQDSLRGLKEHLQKETIPKIKVLEEKETLTVQEDRELKFLRVIREGGSVLEKMTITQLHEILFEEDERKEQDNRNKDQEKNKQELFQERYNKKKEIYDKIKNKIGDEIDQELIKAKERLHEDITRRIKYFEEKEKLTIRKAQELEDLKRPEKMDEEELLMEEYVIHEIYQEQFNREEHEEIIEERDAKKKGKEIERPPIKLELEEGEEYTTE